MATAASSPFVEECDGPVWAEGDGEQNPEETSHCMSVQPCRMEPPQRKYKSDSVDMERDPRQTVERVKPPSVVITLNNTCEVHVSRGTAGPRLCWQPPCLSPSHPQNCLKVPVLLVPHDVSGN